MRNAGNKINWCAVVSLLLSITACIISICRVTDTYVLSDTSYISIIVTLMGICATFIVCYQIYTGITMHERIRKLEKLEESIPDWEQLRYETEGNLELSKGFLFQSRNEYERAFVLYQAALYYFSMSKNVDKVRDMLVNLESCSKGYRKDVVPENENLIKEWSDKIETTANYQLYKTRYADIVKALNLN